MRGIGGPLLNIGDLLSDLSDSDSVNPIIQTPNTPLSPNVSPHLHPSHLTTLFQENYDQLNKALAGTDHSWTSLTLKLCTTLDTAKKLMESTNSNVTEISKKIEELEKIIKRGDSAIEEVKSIHSLLGRRISSSTESEV